MKTFDFLKRKYTYIFACLFLAACQSKPESYTYEDWDQNQDERVEAVEFEQALKDLGYYQEWDLNGDGKIKTREFYQGFFKVWDVNNNGKLDKAEWEVGIKTLKKEDKDLGFGRFEDMDRNRDAELVLEEYQEGLLNTNYYMAWDADQNDYIDETEFSDAYFVIWDSDGDGQIEKAEYEDWHYQSKE